jgi:hypothetical protein
MSTFLADIYIITHNMSTVNLSSTYFIGVYPRWTVDLYRITDHGPGLQPEFRGFYRLFLKNMCFVFFFLKNDVIEVMV